MGVAALTLGGWRRQAARAADCSGVEDRLRLFEAMVARDWDRFHRYAFRLCGGSADDAEDLLSESLLDAFRYFDSYRGEGFDHWFFRLLTNNRIDMARRARARPTVSLDAGSVEIAGDAGADPERRLLDPIYSEPLQQALDALPPEFRAVVLLADVEEMDYQEIAGTLQLPIGTVRSRIHRARAQMRRTLERLGWQP